VISDQTKWHAENMCRHLEFSVERHDLQNNGDTIIKKFGLENMGVAAGFLFISVPELEKTHGVNFHQPDCQTRMQN